MDLSDNNLYKKHDQLIESKKETYDQIYNKCKNKIKLASDSGELICMYEIPSFLFGASCPIIDVDLCAKYLIKKLKCTNKNIDPTFFKPNILFIDWRKKKN